jgi:hypothetical protein
MTYDAVDFVLQYEELLDKVKEVIHPDMHDMHLMLFRFRYLDPHSIITPDTTFDSFNAMIQHLAMMVWVEFNDYGHSLEN